MFICKKCGNTKIEQKEWIQVNSGKPMGATGDPEPESNWCPNCEEHCDIISKDV